MKVSPSVKAGLAGHFKRRWRTYIGGYACMVFGFLAAGGDPAAYRPTVATTPQVIYVQAPTSVPDQQWLPKTCTETKQVEVLVYPDDYEELKAKAKAKAKKEPKESKPSTR